MPSDPSSRAYTKTSSSAEIIPAGSQRWHNNVECGRRQVLAVWACCPESTARGSSVRPPKVQAMVERRRTARIASASPVYADTMQQA
eukprot:scaffold28332_cov31-Tisochrysis_lutea.AAC.8